MNLTCDCGMTLEHPASQTGCEDCGATICRSCLIELDTNRYCRWCATSLGRAAA